MAAWRAITNMSGVSATLVDRPVATWVHEHLGDERFGWFTGTYDGHLRRLGPFTIVASPSEPLGLLAALGLAVLALAASAGWRPTARGRVVLALCLSVFAPLVINSITRVAFGRTWPES